MRPSRVTLANVGSRRSPIDLGDGRFAYKHNGHWQYRDLKKHGRLLHRFVQVTDRDLILELETRGYQIVHPAHECVDRPNLPCPACEVKTRERRP
ncbi:MAG TPA: hypothetical protein VJP02_24070 [Candidatus Sulfotelmatobacter sp.]|nr:hypothetical protein [Candidatus Sulfotelmatobacter sp.]